MNTKALTKHYNTLTPRERLALILAASMRGDIAERERLGRSAKVNSFRVPDHHGLAEGLRALAMHHTATLLDLIANFWIGISCKPDRPNYESSEEDIDEAERIFGKIPMTAYVFCTNVEAWERLCEELNIDANFMLRHSPGIETIKSATEEMRQIAFDEAEANDWIRLTRTDLDANTEVRALTAADILAVMRRSLDFYVEKWR